MSYRNYCLLIYINEIEYLLMIIVIFYIKLCSFSHISKKMYFVSILILFCLLQICSTFYLPGVAPKEFKDKDPVDIKVLFIL